MRLHKRFRVAGLRQPQRKTRFGEKRDAKDNCLTRPRRSRRLHVPTRHRSDQPVGRPRSKREGQPDWLAQKPGAASGQHEQGEGQNLGPPPSPPEAKDRHSVTRQKVGPPPPDREDESNKAPRRSTGAGSLLRRL